MNYEQRIIELLESDELHMRALHAVSSINPPDWLIAAGFVRNLVWGSIFNKTHFSQDIDVVYFCAEDTSQEKDVFLEKQLRSLEPDLAWSVKNQARMHVKNGDHPYKDTLDAMWFWPEKQTSIGVKLDEHGQVVIRHCFDLSLQFSGNIDRNPARSIETFENRISSKDWLKIWPALQVKI